VTRNEFIRKAVLAQIGDKTRDCFVSERVAADGALVRRNDAFAADTVLVAVAFAQALDKAGVEFDTFDAKDALDDVRVTLEKIWNEMPG
jgi:hypothetical protein